MLLSGTNTLVPPRLETMRRSLTWARERLLRPAEADAILRDLSEYINEVRMAHPQRQQGESL